jgi:hypothetical protein
MAEWPGGPETAFDAPPETSRWEQVAAGHVAESGGVDFGALYGSRERGVAYARTRLHSDAERTVEIRFEADDPLAMRLNQETVFETEGREPEGPQQVCTARLRQGLNTLTVRVSQEQGPWRMRFRLTGLDEKPVVGVRDGFHDYAEFAPARRTP